MTSPVKIGLNDQLPLGPVVGPLIMCGYMIESAQSAALKKTGVKDSKMLTKKQREDLAPILRSLASDHILLKIDAKDIDENKQTSNLNKLEMKKIQEIINTLKPDKVIIDAFEVNTESFERKVRAGLKPELKKIELVCENFADKNYVEVSAASVLAKVCRDGHISKLQQQYGFDGTGYASDERTIAFLKDWLEKNNELPDFARKSWFTAKTIVEEKEQRTLEAFFKEFAKESK